MENIIRLLICFFFILDSQFSVAQFTHADTLRGSNGAGRNWWDVLKYDLHVKFNLDDKSINGWNEITFKKINSGNIIQIDLQEPLSIDSIFEMIEVPEETNTAIKKVKVQPFYKDGNAYLITTTNYKLLTTNKLIIYYHGKPQVALNPPWSGGIIYKRDERNRPWISIACQGLGASVWFPCKDHQSDEPDSTELHITAPSDLLSLSNGR